MRRYALFVGVDQYADKNIQDLRCAVNDATELAGFFKHRAGFDRAEALANPRNGEVVLERVCDMLDGLGGGDEFLFFFAGHGIKTLDGHRLVCAGDQLSDVKHSWAGLPLERLKANTSGAFDRLFLLDACRTDVHATHRGAGGAMEEGTRDLILGSAGRTSANGGELTIVCSCDDGECAGESLSFHHGLFTMAMLELLDEESRQGRCVRVTDDFVYGRLPERMRVLSGKSDMVFSQKPQKRGPAILILNGSEETSETAVKSASHTGGRVAAPVLVACPLCGKKNREEETFRCLDCGHENLCLRHQDVETFLCVACMAKRKQNEAAAWAQNEGKRFFRNGEDAYYGGNGVPQNYGEAAGWYRKAAEFGHAEAQYSLGWMHDKGQGVPQDDAQAVVWYRKAAEQGNAQAQFNLGWMYRNGRGVPQSDTEAVKWYRKAAEQGNARAQFNLGWMHDNGKGVTKDEATAAEWYRKAAEQGNEKAKAALAELRQKYAEDYLLDVVEDLNAGLSRQNEEGLAQTLKNVCKTFHKRYSLPGYAPLIVETLSSWNPLAIASDSNIVFDGGMRVTYEGKHKFYAILFPKGNRTLRIRLYSWDDQNLARPPLFDRSFPLSRGKYDLIHLRLKPACISSIVPTINLVNL